MRVVRLALVLLSTGPLLLAQASSAPPPRSRISPAEILEKYVAATGGAEARLKLSKCVVTGDFGFSLQHRLGTYSFYYKAPSDDMLEVQYISHGIFWTGHHEGATVQKYTVEGAGMINGAGMQIVEQDWLSLLETDFQQRYTRIEVVGIAEVGKRWTYAVRFTPKAGDPQVRFFDSETFLLVRLDQVQRFKWNKSDPEVAYRVESFFPEYRDVHGVKLPAQINVNRDIGDLIFSVPSIKTDVEIADSVFVKPGGLK